MKNSLHSHSESGQSLIELLFAMALAVVSISAIAYALLGPQAAARQSIESIQAEALAEEGLAAVNVMTHVSFDDFTEGTFGLLYVDGQWAFDGSSDTHDQFERSVTLKEVSEDLYEVTSVVTWETTGVRESEVSLTSFISNWKQTKGDAASVLFDVSELQYQASGTTITDVTIENIHDSNDVTITDLQFSWAGEASLLEVWIDGVLVFIAATTSAVDSGTIIDIDDVTLTTAVSPMAFGPVHFSADMQTTGLHLVSFLSDGSKRYTRLVP